MPEMKGVTVKIPADLHAEVKAYLEAHGMTMGEFITLAVDNELHPKIQITQEDKNMERMRTLAFQVPDSLFQRVKAYLERNHMMQKQFVIGLIESEIEQDEAQYQASHPEEQEDEEESDDQTEDEETEDEEAEQEAQNEFAPRRPRKAPMPGWRNNPPPTRMPPPWTILRPAPRKCPRRMKKPGKKPTARRTPRTRENRRIPPTPCPCDFMFLFL